MSIDGSKRSTCWSITINNPTKEDEDATQNLQGWKDFIEFKGQLEKGENGTEHIQGMLITRSVKFSAVKKQFPRAHIEIAKSKAALSKYVEKEETKLADLPKVKVATVATLNTKLVFLSFPELKNTAIDEDSTFEYIRMMKEKDGFENEGLFLLDKIARMLIVDGYYGVEYIASNPSTRTAWKMYWREMIQREWKKECGDEE